MSSLDVYLGVAMRCGFVYDSDMASPGDFVQMGPYRLGWDIESAQRFTTPALSSQGPGWFWVRKRYPDDFLAPELRELYFSSVEAVRGVRVTHAVRTLEPILLRERWHEVEDMVPGVDLSRVMRAGGTAAWVCPEAAVHLVGQLCEAIQGMARVWRGRGEASPFVYGHLEPRRVLVSSMGDVWLRRLSHHSWMTRFAIEVISTSRMRQCLYTAPEVLRGEAFCPRSDVFSLGVLLYELVTGVHPFVRESEFDTLSAIVGAATPDPGPGVRPELREVLRLAMAHELEERYATPGALAAALRTLPGERRARPGREQMITLDWSEIVAWFAREPALARDSGMVRLLRRRLSAELTESLFERRCPPWEMLYAATQIDPGSPWDVLPRGSLPKEAEPLVEWLRGERREPVAWLQQSARQGEEALMKRACASITRDPG